MIRKGTYIVLMTFGEDADITVGALGRLHFDRGTYCYVGSAMGGLDQRISRHLAHRKKIKWHIDHLTTAADFMEAYESYPEYIPECDLARIAESSGMVPSHRGFGCSDCRCETHLFKVVGQSLETFLSETGMRRFE